MAVEPLYADGNTSNGITTDNPTNTHGDTTSTFGSAAEPGSKWDQITDTWEWTIENTALTDYSEINTITLKIESNWTDYTNDGFEVQIWDDSASAWVTKKTYSGATPPPSSKTLETIATDLKTEITTIAEINALKVRIKFLAEVTGLDDPTTDFYRIIIEIDYTAGSGWTGKVHGVTNPGKVNGVADTAIAKVNGVA